jgi:hypothetical protein
MDSRGGAQRRSGGCLPTVGAVQLPACPFLSDPGWHAHILRSTSVVESLAGSFQTCNLVFGSLSMEFAAEYP